MRSGQSEKKPYTTTREKETYTKIRKEKILKNKIYKREARSSCRSVLSNFFFQNKSRDSSDDDDQYPSPIFQQACVDQKPRIDE